MSFNHIIRKASYVPIAALCLFYSTHALSQETKDRFEQASDALAEMRYQKEMEGLIFLAVTAAIAGVSCIGLWFLFRFVHRRNIGSAANIVATRIVLTIAALLGALVIYQLNVVLLDEVSRLGQGLMNVFTGQVSATATIAFLVRSIVLWLGVFWCAFALSFCIIRPTIRLIFRR